MKHLLIGTIFVFMTTAIARAELPNCAEYIPDYGGDILQLNEDSNEFADILTAVANSPKGAAPWRELLANGACSTKATSAYVVRDSLVDGRIVSLQVELSCAESEDGEEGFWYRAIFDLNNQGAVLCSDFAG